MKYFKITFFGVNISTKSLPKLNFACAMQFELGPIWGQLCYPFFIILTMEIKRHNYFLFTEKVIRAQRLVTHQFLLRCGQPNFNSPLSGIVRKIISFAYCFKFCGVSDLLPTSPITQKQNILMFCVMNFLFLCISFGLSE